MGYPKKVYLSLNEPLKVFNEEEEKEALSKGFKNIQEIFDELKGIKKEKPFIPHEGDILINAEAPPEVYNLPNEVLEDMQPAELTQNEVPLEEIYEAETGKRAYYFGRETKAFKDWKEKWEQH